MNIRVHRSGEFNVSYLIHMSIYIHLRTPFSGGGFISNWQKNLLLVSQAPLNHVKCSNKLSKEE